MNFARLTTGLALLLIPFAAVTAETNKWEKEIAAFETSDRTNPPPKSPIVFVGSSSIRLWKTLVDDLAPLPVLNRGFGGSEISDSVHFAERIVIPYRPRMVVMYAGGNDIHAGETPETVFEDFKAFVAKITNALPETKIAYISIAPNPARWKEVEQVKAANQLISRYADEHPKVEFINVFPEMLGEDGLPRPDIYVADQLHMNERGYALWTRIIKPRLKL
jgi:lysophospholipase L1-like esterase